MEKSVKFSPFYAFAAFRQIRRFHFQQIRPEAVHLRKCIRRPVEPFHVHVKYVQVFSRHSFRQVFPRFRLERPSFAREFHFFPKRVDFAMRFQQSIEFENVTEKCNELQLSNCGILLWSFPRNTKAEIDQNSRGQLQKNESEQIVNFAFYKQQIWPPEIVMKIKEALIKRAFRRHVKTKRLQTYPIIQNL